MSKITNIPGTICSINFTPIDSGIFIENISRSINRIRGVVNSERKTFKFIAVSRPVDISPLLNEYQNIISTSKNIKQK